MNPELVFYLSAIGVTVLLSMFFSAAETSLISSSAMRLRGMVSRGRWGSTGGLKLLEMQEETISMILIGNNIANIASAAFVTFIAAQIYKQTETGILLALVVQTLFFLMFCEILPKILARAYAENVLCLFQLPLRFLVLVFNPLVRVLLKVTSRVKVVLRLGSTDTSSNTRYREEINVMFKMGEQAGILDESHSRLINEILSMHNITVGQVMTPTIDILSVEKKETMRNLVRTIDKTRYSRVPVYEGRVDNIVGYVHYKDIMRSPDSRVADLLREPRYVPITKRIVDLYHEMLTGGEHMVFVVNEHGAVEGLVTREDVAEEIVGEIQTRDHQAEELIVKTGPSRYMLNGQLAVDYFARYFSLPVQKNGFSTVAGLLMYLTGHIPRKGERIEYNGAVFIVEEANERAVQKVQVVLQKPEVADSENPLGKS